jgi:hypothetical protein
MNPSLVDRNGVDTDLLQDDFEPTRAFEVHPSLSAASFSRNAIHEVLGIDITHIPMRNGIFT